MTLTLDGLVAGYRSTRGARAVVPAASTTVQAGQLVCLLGPNGAGKSTLMSTIGGALTPLAGQVRLDAQDVHQLEPTARARAIAIVTTERLTTPSLTGRQLVALGRHPHTGWFGRRTLADDARIAEAITLAGAEGVVDRPVAELSDGERQRLLMARALCQGDRLLLLDELTAFLDLPRRVEVMRVLHRLTRTAGRAVILSTHDLDLALRTADVLWLLPTGGPLRIGAPEDLVLSGEFAAAFAADGVTFDASTGAFRLDGRTTHPIRLTGDGLGYRWTAHALERAGFHVSDAPAAPHVHVESFGEGYRWQLDRQAPVTSIATLLRRLS